MNRRGFLSGMLALGAAPAIVRADSLMRIVPVETTIVRAVWGGNVAMLNVPEMTVSLEDYESLDAAGRLGARMWITRRMIAEGLWRTTEIEHARDVEFYRGAVVADKYIKAVR